MKLLIVGALIVLSGAAQAADLGTKILARYSNYYAGDDDAFATCLIQEDSKGLVLIDGIVPNSVGTFSIKKSQMQALQAELKALSTKGEASESLLPKDNEVGAVASRVLVPGAYPGYVKVKSGSSLELLLKAICNIDQSGE